MVVKSDDILICWKISFVAFCLTVFNVLLVYLLFLLMKKGWILKWRQRHNAKKNWLLRSSFPGGTWPRSPGHVTLSASAWERDGQTRVADGLRRFHTDGRQQHSLENTHTHQDRWGHKSVQMSETFAVLFFSRKAWMWCPPPPHLLPPPSVSWAFSTFICT